MNDVMRAVVMAVCCIACCPIMSVQAQTIVNGDFESWTGGNPTGWSTANDAQQQVSPVIVQSNDAHGGSSSVNGHVVSYDILPGFGINFAPAMTSTGPLTSRPESLHGFIKYNCVNGDRFLLAVVASTDTGSGSSAGSYGVGAGTFGDTTTVSTFTEFYANMLYLPVAANMPVDSYFVSVLITGRTTSDSVHYGSHFILDDLTFGSAGTNTVGWSDNGPSAVQPAGRVLPRGFDLEQNYPNPFNPSTGIIYDIAEPTHVTLDVYNAVGQKMATLINGHQETGRYKTYFDASHLPSGVYHCVLHTDSFSKTRTMTLIK